MSIIKFLCPLQLHITPSSGVGSMMSLTKTSDDEEGEEDDDDDFKDIISLMEGKVPEAQNGRKAKMEGMYA